METAKTITIKIYVGLREQYSDVVHNINDVQNYLQKYCDDVGYCFSVTETFFIYKNGNEPGVIITIINYPRFPKTRKELDDIAFYITTELKAILKQNRISIVFDDITYML